MKKTNTANPKTNNNNSNELKCEITQTTYQKDSFADRVHKYIRSKTTEELDQNLAGIFTNINDLVAWFEGLIGELSIHTSKSLKEIINSSYKGETIESTLIYQTWDKIGLYLLIHHQNLFFLTLNLYKKFLQTFTAAQTINKNQFVRLHKGGIYHNIGISFLYANEKERAKSYFLLGVIEDILNQKSIDDNDFKKNPGYNNLKSLNVFEDEIKEIYLLKRIINRNITASTIGFYNPELIFLEFLTTNKNTIKTNQFLFWDNSFAKRLTQTLLTTKVKKEQGDYLERLSSYLFFTIGKFIVSSKIKTLHAEHDLRVRNLIVDDPILELLGRYILVECKNWNKKIDSSKVKKFITNVRFARCDTGILITKNEVTGRKSKDSAWYVIRSEYHKDGIIILVITLKDINKIIDEKTNFLDMLKTKYEQVRFDER
jgi:hypothetical protein